VNCRDVEELCGAWLDGELDLVRSVDLEAHVRDCPGCKARLRSEEDLSAALRAMPYQRAPEQLREQVRRQWTPQPRRQWRWIPVLAGAPAFAALVLMFFFLRPPIQHDVVDAHVRSLLANHLLDVPSTDRHTVKPWFAGKLDYSPDVKAPEGFDLIGGRLDYLEGHPVAALVYRRRQHTINVFTWPSAGRDRAPALRSERGFQVMNWTRAGMTWWAVSDLNGEELSQLAASGR
jgi:anti-sigma factor RsiW